MTGSGAAALRLSAARLLAALVRHYGQTEGLARSELVRKVAVWRSRAGAQLAVHELLAGDWHDLFGALDEAGHPELGFDALDFATDLAALDETPSTPE
jgi:hypothetical protein